MIAPDVRPLLASLFVLLPASLHGQLPAPGQWVQVQVYESRVEGRLVRIGPDSIFLENARTDSNLPVDLALLRSDVSRLWVSTGYSRRTLTGLGVGTLAGAGIGALFGAFTAGPCISFICFSGETPAEGALIYGAAVGSLGLVIGVIAGFAAKRHRWAEMDIGLPGADASPARLNVVFDASPRPAMAVRLTF